MDCCSNGASMSKRASQVGSAGRSADREPDEAARDVRGLAVDFLTDHGNRDILGNDMPVSFMDDTIQFPDVIHAVEPEPKAACRRGFPHGATVCPARNAPMCRLRNIPSAGLAAAPAGCPHSDGIGDRVTWGMKPAS